ncbi:hypothetical protein MGG_15772 [Pyricularia oryzae 70-15]|uniref:Uncharacterized protein n=2 Tax=Pyricularia oryzae TaxID=318829 RepID=G4MVU0_PYRO7|nr:uncharacterized protein MGG_15772 [Pyricularia oryzae 70-15]EHA55006.1 hypothetical protein MGG_15772 [Pyricularia oryzae 70-15]KAI7924729.1 hypothetical protein M9X92_003747 [Pyricularia oryzae]KAI7928065.1 hypothetical protein M0657_002906 [Pyricularia oryzae]QBZ56651.1 hypothetical protein PoMZ_01562 [Pyricularia oryzae]
MSARKIFNPCSGSFEYGFCARSSGLSRDSYIPPSSKAKVQLSWSYTTSCPSKVRWRSLQLVHAQEEETI